VASAVDGFGVRAGVGNGVVGAFVGSVEGEGVGAGKGTGVGDGFGTGVGTGVAAGVGAGKGKGVGAGQGAGVPIEGCGDEGGGLGIGVDDMLHSSNKLSMTTASQLVVVVPSPSWYLEFCPQQRTSQLLVITHVW